MQTLIVLGVSMVIAVQRLGEWLILPMRFFSNLGTEEFFFLVLPLIYWCIDSSLGMRVGFILLSSDVLNYVGKLIFAGPRPYWVSSHVKALWSETSFGIPSGHAQHAMSVWGILAVRLRTRWAWTAAGFLIFLIGFSRVYLGAHFPHDVLAGWLIGGLLLFLFARYADRLAAWMGRKPSGQQVLLTFLISLAFIAIGFSTVSMREGFPITETWTSNALLAGVEAPAPVDPNGIFTSAGTLFGLSLGLIWMYSIGGYHVVGPVWVRIVRYLVGLIGVLIFWMGLGFVLPEGEGWFFYSLRYARYTLVGWWVSGGATWVFARIGLAGKPSKSI